MKEIIIGLNITGAEIETALIGNDGEIIIKKMRQCSLSKTERYY